MGVRNGLTEFARLVDILVNVIGYAGRCGSYSPAVKRMADDEIQRLTMERVPVSGLATQSLPRWTHVRPR